MRDKPLMIITKKEMIDSPVHVYSVAQPYSKQLVFPADSAHSEQVSMGKILADLYRELTICYFFCFVWRY